MSAVLGRSVIADGRIYDAGTPATDELRELIPDEFWDGGDAATPRPEVDLAGGLEVAETLDEAVAIAVGAGSTAWESVDQAGEFRSDYAISVVEAVTAWIDDRYTLPADRQPESDNEPDGEPNSEVEGESEPEPESEPSKGPAYDPDAYKVAEVNAYLDDADDDERARVLAAEAAGQARKGIVEGPHAPDAPDGSPGSGQD